MYNTEMKTPPPKIEATKPVIDTSDMDLPEGKTCATCLHYARCKALFACPADAVKCDFAPSRYRADAVKIAKSKIVTP